MGKWENKSSNAIILEIKEMQEEHEGLKTTIYACLDKMDKLEKDFQEGSKIVMERLKQ